MACFDHTREFQITSLRKQGRGVTLKKCTYPAKVDSSTFPFDSTMETSGSTKLFLFHNCMLSTTSCWTKADVHKDLFIKDKRSWRPIEACLTVIHIKQVTSSLLIQEQANHTKFATNNIGYWYFKLPWLCYTYKQCKRRCGKGWEMSWGQVYCIAVIFAVPHWACFAFPLALKIKRS